MTPVSASSRTSLTGGVWVCVGKLVRSKEFQKVGRVSVMVISLVRTVPLG